MMGSTICEQLDTLYEDGADFEALVEKAVELVHASRDTFHWTGVYELFPDGKLHLGPFIGDPTDHVHICVGDGVCGSAVAEKRNRVVPDVSKEENYLACSTSTKSELVVLIRKADEIYAQIDIDSHELDAFDDEAVLLVQDVANWLADHYAARVEVGV